MLEINMRRLNTVAILDLSGSIDIDCANLIEMVGWCLANNYKDILCNFESVNMVDYAGLSVLAIAHKDVANNKGRLKFFGVASHIRNLFCLVYLDRVFEIYQDEELALRSFAEDRAIQEIQRLTLRRRFKRLALDMDVEFKPVSKSEQFSKGKVLNISAVGLLVFAQKTYPLGEILKVRVSLAPEPVKVELEVKVVWLIQKDIQPQIYPGMGLEFYNLDVETQGKIVEFVNRNLPLSCGTEDS